ILVNHDHIVIVGPELQEHIFFEKTEVHFIAKLRQLRDNDSLVLWLIDTHEGRVVTEVERAVVDYSTHHFLAPAYTSSSSRNPVPRPSLIPRDFWIRSIPREMRPFLEANSSAVSSLISPASYARRMD